MSTMEATATAVTTRTGPWFKRQYMVRLFINKIDTGLHWHVKRREVNKISADIVDNAAELLHSFGIMDAIYGAVKCDARNLPAIGSKVELTIDIGPYKKGIIGTVVALNTDDDGDEWPVYVALTAGDESDELALSLSELKAVA